MVGATAAHTLAVRQLVPEIVMIDVAAELVQGQAADINHTTGFSSGVLVRTGEYTDLADGDIVVVTCGIPQKPGQSRLELLSINAGIIRDVMAQIAAQDKDVTILMVSNPVDVLTMVALEASGFPRRRVFGSGTTLDTSRLRALLAQDLKVNQADVTAYVLGEHGDSSFSALSGAAVGGVPLAKMPGYSPQLVEGIDDRIRRAAYDIIAAKRATYYGIGQTVAVIVEAMLKPVPTILPVCSLATGEYGIEGITLGLPSLVSRDGAYILPNLPLDAVERQKLEHSASVVREALGSLKQSV
jgi:L-lactate dehydrogenase